MTRKICAVITARPSYSRVKSALRAIQQHPDLELQLVVAASALLERYGSTIHYIEQDGFKVAARVYMVLEGENLTTMVKTTGLGMIELASVFDNLQPDIVLTIADRYETIATAIAASYMNIPVAHIQGGEITGSIDEKVRHAVTKLSNLHFVSTQKSAERVIRMGEDPSSVYVTGCPSIDLAAEIMQKPQLDFDPLQRYGGVGESIDYSKGFLVVMQHPVTTEHEVSRDQITETLFAIRDSEIPTFWFWPNVDAGSDGTSKGIRVFREIQHPPNIHFFRNMVPNDFLRLIYNSHCIVGNSSVAIRECSFLGVPAVNIGSRESGRERGCNVIDVDYNRFEILTAIHQHIKNGKAPSDPLYGDGHAGERIAGLLSKVQLQVEKKDNILTGHNILPDMVADQIIKYPILHGTTGSLSSIEKITLGNMLFLVRPKLVLELGVLEGATTLFISEFMSINKINGRIVGFDIPKVVEKLSQENGSLSTYIKDGRIELIKGYLPNTLRAYLTTHKEEVDFALIDARHEYQSVMSELNCIWRFLNTNGIVFVHDYSNNYPGICLAVRKFAYQKKALYFPFVSSPFTTKSGTESTLVGLRKQTYRKHIFEVVPYHWLSIKRNIVNSKIGDSIWRKWLRQWLKKSKT